MNDDWKDLAGDYHDNCFTDNIQAWLNNKDEFKTELKRLNNHRKGCKPLTEEQLTWVLEEAFRLREGPPKN